MKKILITGAILAAGVGVFAYYKKQAGILTNMKYDVAGAKFISFDGKQLIIALTLRIESESRIEAELTGVNLDVLIEGETWGNITELSPIIIPAKGYSLIELQVTIYAKDIRNNVVNLAGKILQKKDASVVINGYAKVKSGWIKTTVPFTYETTLKEMIQQ